ncbi:MAG TPA: iron-siderophore ABC transporter substrate-binding protein [Nocardioidaceae bacterium]|nr:iron-siderophore ABC transporter substrate-binding protein [Nocardioidaceae bacterium]
MIKTWTRIGVLLLSAVLLAACSSSAADDSSDASNTETRTVQHAMGTAEVPVHPERVVVLDTGELDDTLALGVKPVGAVRVDASTDFLSYLGDQTAGIEMVGTISEPNLEAIAALDPDLILSSTVRHEAIYDQLKAIAPTVLAPDLGDTWKDNFRLYAEALNKKQQAERMITDFEERAAELGKTLPEDMTLGLVRFLPGQIRLYSDQSFHGTILSDMGVQVPAAARGEDTFLELSPEQVTKADADVIYVSTYGPDQDTDKAEVIGGPLWKTLDAVQQGDVHPINDDLLSGIGIQAAQQSLDLFEKQLG